MEIKKVSIDTITAYEFNAKEHPKEQIEQIKKSIIDFGNCDPIAVDEDGVIIEGHGRYIALTELGYKEVEIIRLEHLTEEQKKAYRLIHNKLTMNSDFDFDLLEQELSALQEIDMTDFGFDLSAFDEPKEIIEDEVPEVDEENEPITQYGDIWQLGRHRLLCGDSTDKTTVEMLMNGSQADIIFTDPPYNVSFNGRSGKFDVIKNDNLSEEDFNKFINKSIEIIKSLQAPNYYIWCNWKFYSILQKLLPFNACIVWGKNVFGLGNGYRHQHEFCLFNGSIDNDIKNETDLWEVAKDSNYIHPTQKPVELCARALNNHKKCKNIVDLFGGSGSTLIACEQLERTCYTMELDPKYCDVIIKRWETLTGQIATKL